MHARCVSGGIEGDETVFESLNVQMDFGGKPPKLACQELKIQSKFLNTCLIEKLVRLQNKQNCSF